MLHVQCLSRSTGILSKIATNSICCKRSQIPWISRSPPEIQEILINCIFLRFHSTAWLFFNWNYLEARNLSSVSVGELLILRLAAISTSTNKRVLWEITATEKSCTKCKINTWQEMRTKAISRQMWHLLIFSQFHHILVL